MALNFKDGILIRGTMLDRVQAVVVNYALYILGQGSGVSNGANRVNWATVMMSNTPQQVQQFADKLSYYMLDQDDFKNNGTSISDDTLKSMLETAINNNFIPAA